MLALTLEHGRQPLAVGLLIDMMQSYPPKVLDRRLQEDWTRAAKKGLGVLMNPMVDF